MGWELELRNAIIEQAFRDYELLISDIPQLEETDFNLTGLEQFFRYQNYTDMHLDVLKDKVLNVYKKKFRPYVAQNASDIKKMTINKIKKMSDKQRLEYPHRCPNCGGLLYRGKRPYQNYIVCSYCNLNMSIPKEAK